MTTTHMCPKCGTNPSRSKRAFCEVCRVEARRRNRQNWADKYPERNSAARRKWTVEKRRANDLKVAYGLTVDEYEGFLAAQNGVCGICQQPEKRERNGKTLPLAVDHDHETGRVRGLLCHRCNTAIGLLNDDADVVRRALLWLGEDSA